MCMSSNLLLPWVWQNSYFRELLPSSIPCTRRCCRKRLRVRNIVDLGAVSREVSNSASESGDSALTSIRATKIRTAVGRIPFSSNILVIFSLSINLLLVLCYSCATLQFYNALGFIIQCVDVLLVHHIVTAFSFYKFHKWNFAHTICFPFTF